MLGYAWRMKWILKRIGRLLAIIAMASLTFAMVRAISRLPLRATPGSALFSMAIGLACGLILLSLFPVGRRLYVIGHELTHFLTAKLFRRRTGKLRIKSDHGSVSVENPNIWIILAPYFVPFYALVWLILIMVVQLFYQSRIVTLVAYGGLGFLYAYHLVTTVWALQDGQSDLDHHGRVLSFSLIICVNVMILFFSLMLLSNNFKRGILEVARAYEAQYRAAKLLFVDDLTKENKSP